MNNNIIIERKGWQTLLACLSLAFVLYAMAAETGHEEDHEENVTGSHGGRLLESGAFSLELAIEEAGRPPEFRAWAMAGGVPLDPDSWSLEVRLTRLGGDTTDFEFEAVNDYRRGDGVVEEPHSFDVEVSAGYQGQTYQWHYGSYEGRLELSPEVAEYNEVTTVVAGPGILEQRLLLYGRTVPDPQRISHISARYPGMIVNIVPMLGETVNAGETIATIEASASLQHYDMSAPISGMVVDRHANPGENTGDRALLTIADYTRLWVELSVFPGDAERVRPDQPVRIRMGGLETESEISYLNPGEGRTPEMFARVPLPNPEQRWSPGLLVEAQVLVDTQTADLLIDNRALQTFRDWQVVFIKVGDSYEIRPLTLGRSNGEFSEVLFGLAAGDEYVVGNSYLLKADLEKDGASHDH